MQVFEASAETNDSDNVFNILLEKSAILKGHFMLTSGLHSDTYIQCAKLHESPSVCEHLCRLLLKKVQRERAELLKVDMVVAPAMGGVLFGYEIARLLGVNFVFLERVEGFFTLRRGFSIKEKDRILIIEDVITTGKSSLEVYDVVTSMGGVVVGELSIITRSRNVHMPFPFMSLLSLDIKNYSDSEVPEYLAKIPISKPGSRQI
ncbi:MAG: orotate phosphoribosyltransferase [Aaplasma endosymbiont of Hyalomma asiaticum]